MNPFNDIPFDDIVRYGIAGVVIIAILIAVMYSIWWWLLLITSGGKEEKVKPAINHIRHAAIGLVILILVIFIAPVFLRIFSFEYSDSFRPASIFATIQEVVAKMFWGTSWLQDEMLFDSSLNTPRSQDSNFTDL